MTEQTVASYSCSDEANGKPVCTHWCGLPGKCISNMTPPTTGFATFTFVEREAPGHPTQFDDWNAMKGLLEASRISTLASMHNYQLSIDRTDLPRLTRRLERILRAISPYIDWSEPTTPPRQVAQPSDERSQLSVNARRAGAEMAQPDGQNTASPVPPLSDLNDSALPREPL